jgi:hypothetical protein
VVGAAGDLVAAVAAGAAIDANRAGNQSLG